MLKKNIEIKILICFLVFLICATKNYAEDKSPYFSLIGFDISELPTIKCNYFLFDTNGTFIKYLDPKDIVLKENNTKKNVFSISCPNDYQPQRISAILTIDISGSMESGGIQLAKSAAKTWVNLIALDRSQCAITTFHHISFINQDFTNDKQKLIQAIDNIKVTIGGTNYDAGLLSKPTGALELAEHALYRPVIVFLTDGNSDGKKDSIIKKAKAMNAIIHTISIDMPASDILKSIANETGGNYYEYVKTQEEIESIYRVILQQSQEVEPCSFEWLSNGCISNRFIQIYIPNYNIYVEASLVIADSLLPHLEFLPVNYIQFGKVLPHTTSSNTITIKAIGDSIKINSINSSNNKFSIIDYGGDTAPFTLKNNESRTLTIRFSPIDSSISFAKFNIQSTSCTNSVLYAEGGFPGILSSESNLEMVFPNGNEELVAGSDTNILWDGVLPIDTCLLEYSINNGVEWTLISNSITGLQCKWKVPNVSSNKSLMMVKHISPRENLDSSLLSFDMNSANSVCFSPDGDFLAAGYEDGLIKIWNCLSKQLYKVINTKNGSAKVVKWHPFLPLIASIGNSNEIQVWDINKEAIKYNLVANESFLNYIDWNRKGDKIASVSKNGILTIWDTTNLQIIHNFQAHHDIVNSLAWNASGDTIATASADSTIKIWDLSNETNTYSFKGQNSIIKMIDWNPKHSLIASAGSNNNVFIWNTNSNTLFKQLVGHNAAVNSIAWSPNGNHLVSAGNDLSIKIWDTFAGNEIKQFNGHLYDVSCLDWSANENIIASSSLDQTVRLWAIDGTYHIEPIMQTARSAKVWSIVQPKVTSHDVNLGFLIQNDYKDSVVVDFLKNNSPYFVRVDSIIISGTNANDFSLPNNKTPFVLAPFDVFKLEFRFHSDYIGAKKANFTVFTQNDTLKHSLDGECISPKIQILNDFIDFGQISVGNFAVDTIIALKNLSGTSISFTKVELAGPDTAQFRITENFDVPFRLEYNSEHSISAKFFPKSNGKTSSSIALFYNGPNSPIKIQLLGEGISPEILTSSLVEFPPSICGSQITEYSLHITNSGNANLMISSASITGINNNYFKLKDNIADLIIEPDSSKVLQLQFIADNSFDKKNAILVLHSNATNSNDGNTYINLVASRYDVGFDIIPNIIDFKDISEFTPASNTFSIINTGTYPLKWQLPISFNKFSINSIVPNPTLPNSFSIAKVDFHGAELGFSIDTTYSFVDTCKNSKNIQFRANVVSTNQPIIAHLDAFDFPIILCDNIYDTTISIENKGISDLIISSATFSIGDTNDFAVKEFSPIVIKPFTQSSMTLTFSPKSFGKKNAILSISSNAFNTISGISNISVSALKENVDFSLSTDTLFFSTAIENTQRDATFSIINNGSFPLRWTLPISLDYFDIIDINPPTTLPDFGSSDVKIRFKGALVGESIQDSLIFKDTCGNSKTINLFANVRRLPYVLFKIPNTFAKPGDIVKIPILLKDSMFLINSGIDSISATLKLNSSLLVPLDKNNKGKIINGIRYLDFDFSIFPIQDNILASIDFVAVLGNSDTCSIDLINIKTNKDADFVASVVPGSFTIIGICKEGGKRLIFNKNIIDLEQNSPNPSLDFTNICFSLNFHTNSVLTLYNSYGNKIKEFQLGNLIPGKYQYKIDINDINSGIYMYSITTSIGIVSNLMTICK